MPDAHLAWQLRSASASDARRIAAIHREAFEAALPYIPRLHSPDEDLAFFGSAMETQHSVVAASTEGDEVLGFVMWTAGWVNHLYIAPGLQRRGIGALLLDAAGEWHVERNIQQIHLWTFQRNDRARRFYQKHGFRPVEFTDGRGNEEREPDVHLVRQVRPQPRAR